MNNVPIKLTSYLYHCSKVLGRIFLLFLKEVSYAYHLFDKIQQNSIVNLHLIYLNVLIYSCDQSFASLLQSSVSHDP